MPIVRALTLHIKSPGTRRGEAIQILETLKRSLETGGVPVWTLRISFSEDFDWKDVAEYCEAEVLLAAYHKSVEDVKAQELVEYLTKCARGYATILASAMDLELLPKLYLELSKALDEDYFTRVGVSYGSYVQTPYFPISTALGDSVSVAYRYIDVLLSTEPKQWVSATYELAKRVSHLLEDKAGEVGLRVYHDLSVSPWMAESSVDVVERLGAVFPRVGTLEAIHRVNSMLAEAARRVASTGFNELMLPVAEDDRLKELVREGELRIEDLVSLSAACVAGLDMVAVPREYGYLKSLFADTYTVFSIKRRPYGVRIIPTDKPVVSLSRFGDLPAFGAVQRFRRVGGSR